jgi:hypothetical protein
MENVIGEILRVKITGFYSRYRDMFGVLKRVMITLGCAFILFGPMFFVALAEKHGKTEVLGNFAASWLGGSVLLDLFLLIIVGAAVLIIMGLKQLFIWIRDGS